MKRTFTYIQPHMITLTWFVAAALLISASSTQAPAFAEPAAEQSAPAGPVDYQQQVDEAEKQLKADPDDDAARLKLGQAYYYLSVTDEKKASKKANKKALEHLGKLLKDSPQDPVVLIYHGASELIKARHAWAPWSKGEIAKSGLIKMLEAGELARDTPHHAHVIAVRGVSTHHLPEIFEYQDKANADLAEAAPLVTQAWKDGRITANLAAITLYLHGQALKKSGETDAAMAAFQKAAAITTETPSGAAAQKELEANQ